MIRYLPALIIFAALAIGSCKDQSICKKNSDCDKGEVCEETWHEGTGCTSTSSCNEDGSICFNNQNCDSSGFRYECAVVPCSASSDCAATGTACRDGFCDEAVCQDWTQCENGEACKAGFCTASECTVSCDQPRACRQGVCQIVACADISGCSAGEQCRDGNCMQ
jgi:hypothetical protein